MSSFCPKFTARLSLSLVREVHGRGLSVGRAIVLFTCLIAAAAVATYTHFSERGERAPIYTVRIPHPPADVAPVASSKPPAPAVAPQRATATPGDRASLARELQRELKRVGCYSGEVNGVWTTSSRMAMKSFTDQVNASLPIDNPDYVLLSLVQGHQDKACTSQVLAKTPAEPTSEPKAEPRTEKSSITTGSVVPAAAAAATALTAAAVIPKSDAKVAAPEDRPRTVATPPPSSDEQPRSGRPERAARQGGPLPSERVYERRPRRTSNSSQPPKFVRNLFRALGIN